MTQMVIRRIGETVYRKQNKIIFEANAKPEDSLLCKVKSSDIPLTIEYSFFGCIHVWLSLQAHA